MTPERLAFLAGVAWLRSGVSKAPDCNALAELIDPEKAGVNSLEFVCACVPVADAVAWVLATRKNAARKPAIVPEVPRW